MDVKEVISSAITHNEYSLKILRELLVALDSAVEEPGPSGPTGIGAPIGAPELLSIKEWDATFRAALDQLLVTKRPKDRKELLIKMKGLITQAIDAIDQGEREP